MFKHLFPFLFAGKHNAGSETEVARDLLLQVYLDDTQCTCITTDKAGTEVSHTTRLPDDNVRGVSNLLAITIDNLPDDLSRRIGDVQIFLDDPAISVVDSRQAKLTHFEGRALAEFGKYQLGGKPVCFASHRFGSTGAHEAEKRAVAYISEDRLTTILYALGKLARYATFFGPWSVQSLFQQDCSEPTAHISVHGDFSTLTLANASAGTLAVRQLPFGSNSLVAAYAAGFEISEAESSTALRTRDRLGPAKLSENEPGYHTGTRHTLREPLAAFGREIGATADYFEFQRLSGRAATLSFFLANERIAGFARWLSEMLDIKTLTTEDPAGIKPKIAPALNLLEGMRTGLLKIGGQEFDFVGGQFARAKGAIADSKIGTSKATIAKWKAMSGQPVSSASLRALSRPAAVAGAAILALGSAYFYLPTIFGQDQDIGLNLYNANISRLDHGFASNQKGAPEPVLWSKDLITIAGAMPYEMKLKRAFVTAAANNTPASLQLVGVLPRAGGDNLELIGEFLKQLKGIRSLHNRFSDVSFAGLGEGDDKDGTETSFKIIAKLGATPP